MGIAPFLFPLGLEREGSYVGKGSSAMLITCSECGKKISDRAQCCPQCGAPLVAGHVTSISGLKRSVALVFAIFLGILGSHNRYLGYNKKANVELAIGIASLILFSFGGYVVLLILWLWAIVESLACKVDGDGCILQ